ARVLEVQTLKRENRTLRRALDEPVLLDSASPLMQRALDTARQAAGSDVTVLLTGESGTGKNVLASAIHAWSPRQRGAFVTVACTTLAEHLLESELFGNVKGAFTGAWKDKPGRLEAAEHGTVFLDEVGDLPLELQGKLLRFLEQHRFERVGGSDTIEVDAHVLAATHRDLEAEVAAGRGISGHAAVSPGARAAPHRAGARRCREPRGGRGAPRHQRDDALAQAQALRHRLDQRGAPAPRPVGRSPPGPHSPLASLGRARGARGDSISSRPPSRCCPSDSSWR